MVVQMEVRLAEMMVVYSVGYLESQWVDCSVVQWVVTRELRMVASKVESMVSLKAVQMALMWAALLVDLKAVEKAERRVEYWAHWMVVH